MKILVPITYAELGGSQIFLLKLIDAFSEDRSVQFSVILFQEGPLTSELERRNIPFWVMKYSMMRPWTLLPVIRKIREISPDVIYLHAGRVFAVIARLLGIPSVERINMSRTDSVKGWCSNPWIDRICTSLNTKALAVSTAIAKQLTDRGVDPAKVVVIRNFVEVERFHHPEKKAEARKLLGIPDGMKLVVNIGRFTEQKAQQDFISAAAETLKKEPSVFFLLVGDGPKEAVLREQMQNAGIADHFRFEPFRKDIEIVYHAADIMLHTAHWAPLDNVLLEAMAAELTIIASDVDGTKEVIHDGETGLLFPVGNIQQAFDLLLKVLKDPSHCRMLAGKAFELAVAKHSIPAVRFQFKTLFTELAELKH